MVMMLMLMIMMITLFRRLSHRGVIFHFIPSVEISASIAYTVVLFDDDDDDDDELIVSWAFCLRGVTCQLYPASLPSCSTQA